MNTPTGPRADEPIDGQVRNLLWRLRAHAVTPPAEQRVQADLDRLLSAARIQAHLAPSGEADARPSVDAEVAFVTPDHPLHPPWAILDAEVASLAEARARRSWAPSRAVGRVAAAMVVVLVASGAAGARDGVVHLQALLGRGDVPVAMDAGEDILPAPTAADAEDRLAVDADLDDPTAETSTGFPEGTQTDAPDTPDEVRTTTEAQGETRSKTDAAGSGSTTSDAPPAGTSSGGTSTGGSTDGSGAKAPAPTPDTPEPDAVEPEPEEPILAAPAEPEDVLGAGGPRGCGTERLADCLPSDDEDAADEPDPSAEDESSASKADELAQRRFQKPSSEPPEDAKAAETTTD